MESLTLLHSNWLNIGKDDFTAPLKASNILVHLK